MTISTRPPIPSREFVLAGHGAHGRTGVLLVHGLAGTPNEVRLLGRSLQSAGFEVHGVQLAGHCGTVDDLVATHWQDWIDSVHAGAQRLRARVDRLVVMGLSMGAVLALEVAAARPDLVDGVGALSTSFWHDGWSMPFFTRLAFMLKPVRALGIGRRRMFLERPPYGIRNEGLRKYVVAQMRAGDSGAAGLSGTPWYSIIEMHDLSKHVRRNLRFVRAPCLVVHATEDDVSSIANADLVSKRVQGSVERLLLDNSFHMVTIDSDRRLLTERAIEFVRRIASARTAESSPEAERQTLTR
ncbi:MAG: alpha/beta fold hydrolase [Pseudomonadota bacterium]|nr:alpha/beta fold hydrolase [Pseudomonadota bacterium]